MPIDPPVNRVGDALPDSDADPHSSHALLLRAREGDEEACNELCARYLPRLRRWAHGRLPGWASFAPRHERAFCGYVSQALRNRLRDAVRRALVRPAGEPLSPEEPTGDPSPLEQAVGVQMLGRYDSALQRLREADRELVVARVELGLDYAEIAGLLDKPSISAARVAVSRALVRLAAEMGLD